MIRKNALQMVVILTWILNFCNHGCAPKSLTRPVTKKPHQTTRPKWINTPPYNPDFFYGVGVALATGNPAEDRKKADDAARLDIAAQLKVKVKGIISSVMEYKKEESEHEIQETFSQELFSIVEETLEGVKILKRWYDSQEGVYYSLASMSISEFRARLENRIKEATNQAQDYYWHAREAQKVGSIPAALRSYANVLKTLQVVEDVPIQLDLDGDGTLEFVRPAVKRQIKSILSNLEIIKLNNNQKIKLGGTLQKPFIAKVLYKGKPVQDMPFVFEFVRGKGQIDSLGRTNSSGIVSCRVYKAKELGTNVIKAKVDFSRLMKSIHNAQTMAYLDEVYTKFLFTTEPQVVLVRMIETNLGKTLSDSYVEEALIERLASEGFEVISPQKAKAIFALKDIEDILTSNHVTTRSLIKGKSFDILIVGKSSTEFSKRVMWNVNLCYARATVKAIEVGSGKVLLSKDLSQVKGFANTIREAGIRALKEASKEIASTFVPELKAMLFN